MSKQSDLISVSQGAAGDPLFIDAANNRVGVGTNSPAYNLQVQAGSPIIAAQSSGANGTRLLLSAEDGAVYIGNTYSSSNVPIIFTQAGTSSGVERMRIDTAGRVTMPYQPAFRAIVNNEAYLTTSPVPFGTTTLNVGNHFNTGTYTFTAPIAGVYFIFVGMYLKTDNNQDAYPSLLINGVGVQYSYLYNLGTGGRIDNTVVVARIISLSASDTVSVVFSGSGEYYGGYRETYFSGYLLG